MRRSNDTQSHDRGVSLKRQERRREKRERGEEKRREVGRGEEREWRR